MVLRVHEKYNRREKKRTDDGVWLSLARAPGLGPGGRRFESCHPDSKKYARVAQLVEHDLAKVGAAGSSPVSRSLFFAEAFVFKSFRYFYIKITQVEFVVVLTDI